MAYEPQLGDWVFFTDKRKGMYWTVINIYPGGKKVQLGPHAYRVGVRDAKVSKLTFFRHIWATSETRGIAIDDIVEFEGFYPGQILRGTVVKIYPILYIRTPTNEHGNGWSRKPDQVKKVDHL